MSFDDKKQVLLIVRWPVSGIRNYLRYVFNHEDFADCFFTVIAPDIDFSRYFENEFPAENFRYCPCENSSRSMFKVVLQQLWHNKYDLVNAHGFSSGLTCVLLSRLRRVPFLMTTHDVFFERNFAGWKGKVKRSLYTLLFNQMHKIMPVGEDAKNNVLQFLPSLNRNLVVANRNGIDTKSFSQALPTDLTASLPEAAGSYRVGFLGRFMSQKGFTHLLQAIGKLHKAENADSICIICFGDGGFIREDRQKIVDLGLEKYFYFLPYTDNVAGVIKALDLVVMPSLWEACPLLAMEVLSCGTPLIGTNCIGLKEVIKDTPAQMIPMADPELLAEAILNEKLHQLDRKEEFQRFASKAVERFDVELHVKKLEPIIRALID